MQSGANEAGEKRVMDHAGAAREAEQPTAEEIGDRRHRRQIEDVIAIEIDRGRRLGLDRRPFRLGRQDDALGALGYVLQPLLDVHPSLPCLICCAAAGDWPKERRETSSRGTARVRRARVKELPRRPPDADQSTPVHSRVSSSAPISRAKQDRSGSAAARVAMISASQSSGKGDASLTTMIGWPARKPSIAVCHGEIAELVAEQNQQRAAETLEEPHEAGVAQQRRPLRPQHGVARRRPPRQVDILPDEARAPPRRRSPPAAERDRARRRRPAGPPPPIVAAESRHSLERVLRLGRVLRSRRPRLARKAPLGDADQYGSGSRVGDMRSKHRRFRSKKRPRPSDSVAGLARACVKSHIFLLMRAW